MVHSFPLELKAISETGEFAGVASVYGVKDLASDVVDKGAFSKTLADGGRERPLLWQHESPIGLVTLTDTPTALQVTGKLTLAVQQARDAYEFLRTGVVKGLSIGFQTVRETYVDNVRHLQEIKLWECSLVTFPCLPVAGVTSVKSTQHNEILIALRSFRQEILGALQKK